MNIEIGDVPAGGGRQGDVLGTIVVPRHPHARSCMLEKKERERGKEKSNITVREGELHGLLVSPADRSSPPRVLIDPSSLVFCSACVRCSACVLLQRSCVFFVSAFRPLAQVLCVCVFPLPL